MINRIKHPGLAVALAASAVAVGACDWRTFDDLSDGAAVESSGAPSALDSGDYGVGVAFGGGMNTAGATFVVAGKNRDGVAMVSYAADGSRTTGGELIDAVVMNEEPLLDPAPIAGDAANGAVGLGVTENADGRGRMLIYSPDGPTLLSAFEVGPAGVDALGFGAVNNPESFPDLTVVTGDVLTVVSNYQESNSASRTAIQCRLDRETGYAIAIADVDNTSPDNEIIVASGNQSRADAPSTVQVFTGALVSEAAAASVNLVECFTATAPARVALAELAPPGGEADFGAQIVAANFDGTGGLDLAISAPSTNTVYVYMNLDVNAPGTPLTVSGPSGSSAFGGAMAAGDFNSDGSDELVVGDSTAAAEGKTNAGRAWILTGTDLATAIELGDAEPDKDQRFGRSLAVGTFGGSDAMLVVGAKDELFTYFQTPVAGDTDLRE